LPVPGVEFDNRLEDRMKGTALDDLLEPAAEFVGQLVCMKLYPQERTGSGAKLSDHRQGVIVGVGRVPV